MTTGARDLLTRFDALPPAERQQVAVEILRRTAADEDLPAVALAEVGGELFQLYDTEEHRAPAAPADG